MADNLRPSNSLNVSIRTIRESDSQAILAWRNNPDVRKWSRHQEVITEAEHEKWLGGWLEPNHQQGYFFIVESPQFQMGMVRFDSKLVNEFEISIVIGPKYQKRGVARTAIALSLHEISLKEPSFNVLATIHANNLLSISLFITMGYVQTVFGEEFLHFRREYTLQDFK